MLLVDPNTLQIIDELSGPPYRFDGVRYQDIRPDGTLIAADKNTHSIKVIAQDGTLLQVLGTEGIPGFGPGVFTTPEGVELLGDIVWLSDSGNDRVVKYWMFDTGSSPAPLAQGDLATVVTGNVVLIDVLANDVDDSAVDPTSVLIMTPPANATLGVDPVDGSITYFHDGSGPGTDSFTYTVEDDQSATSNEATVTVTITAANAAPVAVNDLASVVAGTPEVIDVLANDLDDGLPVDPLLVTAAVVTGPTTGTVSGPDGSGALTYAYTGTGPFPDTDSFTYTVEDDQSATSNEATVTVTITDTGPTSRVTAGLQSLYTFDAGSGNTVFDVSGIGTPIHLTIANPANVSWGAGVLSVNVSTLIASAGAATKLNTAIPANNAITMEAWLTPANTTQTGPVAHCQLCPRVRSTRISHWDKVVRAARRVRVTMFACEPRPQQQGNKPSLSSPAGLADYDAYARGVHARCGRQCGHLY